MAEQPGGAELVGADDLDYEAYTDLQRAAFAELLDQRGASSEHLVPAYFRWKYHPPAGPAWIAVVRDGAGYAAANAMFPVTLRHGDRLVRAFQSCDTATRPEARGKGLFGACLRALSAALAPDDVFFGFPNASSIRGFEKLGWRVRAPVDVFVKPLWGGYGGDDPAIRTLARAGVTDLGATDIGAALAAAWPGRTALDRSAAYLRWRYLEHPVFAYAGFVYDDGAGRVGLAVVRPATVFGRRVAVALELVGTDAAVERSLAARVRAWASAERLHPIVRFDTALPLVRALAGGYVPVWARLLPKRQILMGAPMGGEAAAVAFDAPWRVQMGDWDGF